MQTKDHRNLALKLIGASDDEGLWQHRRAFMFGCIEPDMNPMTYTRGSLHHRRFRGHNAENARQHIHQCLETLQSTGLYTPYSYFVLGTLLHYVADTFTFPHNEGYTGTLLEHRAYEGELHRVFSRKLASYSCKNREIYPYSAWRAFSFSCRRYASAPRTMETDCEYIIQACGVILNKMLYCTPCVADVRFERDHFRPMASAPTHI